MDPKFLQSNLNEPFMEAAYQVENHGQTEDLRQVVAAPRNSIHPVQPDDKVEILKVSAKSRPALVAGAVAGVLRQASRVELQAIGAGATNQAIKAIAIARGYLISSGIDISFIPAFIDIIIEGEERTAIKFIVEKRNGFTAK